MRNTGEECDPENRVIQHFAGVGRARKTLEFIPRCKYRLSLVYSLAFHFITPHSNRNREGGLNAPWPFRRFDGLGGAWSSGRR